MLKFSLLCVLSGEVENLDKLVRKCLLDSFRHMDEEFLKKASSQWGRSDRYETMLILRISNYSFMEWCWFELPDSTTCVCLCVAGSRYGRMVPQLHVCWLWMMICMWPIWETAEWVLYLFIYFWVSLQPLDCSERMANFSSSVLCVCVYGGAGSAVSCGAQWGWKAKVCVCASQ